MEVSRSSAIRDQSLILNTETYETYLAATEEELSPVLVGEGTIGQSDYCSQDLPR